MKVIIMEVIWGVEYIFQNMDKKVPLPRRRPGLQRADGGAVRQDAGEHQHEALQHLSAGLAEHQGVLRLLSRRGQEYAREVRNNIWEEF